MFNLKIQLDMVDLSKNNKMFYIVSLGCRVNRAEVDDYSSYLISNSWEISDLRSANLIIVNTCTVTAVADKKTRQAVHKVCRANINPNATILLTGCACAINNEAYQSMDSRIVVVPKANVMTELEKICGCPVYDIKKSSRVLFGGQFRTRAAIKIQDGCNNDCTFCIVHTARGKSISTPHVQVEQKFAAMLDAGLKEIVLTGVNLGAYSDDSMDLAALCHRLLGIIDQKFPGETGVPARLRLSSIEPQNVSDQLIELIALSKGRICKHLHLPLQSGSSKVLKDMNRHYDAQQYLDLVKRLRAAAPKMALSTDIIVGFPGETDADFAQTFKVAKKCSFMKIHVFPYSIRQNTPAANREDQVPHQIKVDRAKHLRELSDKLAKQDFDNRVGTTEFALCEKQGFARLDSYHTIQVDKSHKPGDLFSIKI